jgi:hypothetical protein
MLIVRSIGIEICNAEWQSRGVAEIIFKSVAVHISTLVLVAEYAAALNMPNGKKACFILGAIIYPTWTMVALVLRILTVCLKRILSACRKRKYPKEPLVSVSEALDMHAEAGPGNNEDQLGASGSTTKPPVKISLQELDTLSSTEHPP